ncbi:MAG: hypothetical protein Q4C11_05410 [Clostridium sp.]|nr:hypothetical protein [Clostridium sp.]
MILAGVSISLLLDENGIIKKSKDARREYGQAKANEQEDLSNLSDMIDEATAEPPPKVDVNTKAGDNSTINGKKGNSNNPTIPKNYIPIDTATSTWGDGSSAPSQDSVNHGLVIKDEQNNEWVWIPVDKATLATMYEESSDEKTLCGTTGETAVKTKLYSKTMTIGTDSNKKTMSRTTPGTTADPYSREPDLVVESGSSYDAKDTYYKTILGETGTKEQLAQLFVDEYKAMIESVSKYGGFYIGRYELSEAGVQKDRQPLTNTNWYNLYNVCRDSKLQASDKVKTQMIWGCQWDVTMNWLISSGAKTSDEVNKDSSSWGNYEGTSVKADDGTTEIKANGTSAKLNTGKTTFTMANNIYDLAGNCYEWTQEAYGTYRRDVRGGYYNINGPSYPASSHNNFFPDYSGYDDGRYSSYFNNKVKIEEYKFKCVKSKKCRTLGHEHQCEE